MTNIDLIDILRLIEARYEEYFGKKKHIIDILSKDDESLFAIDIRQSNKDWWIIVDGAYYLPKENEDGTENDNYQNDFSHPLSVMAILAEDPMEKDQSIEDYIKIRFMPEPVSYFGVYP
jgi:hypothetical protein